MPISGLVVTLAPDHKIREHALEAIAADPRVEMGEQLSHRLAIIVETSSSAEDRLFWHWLNELSGVEFVEVAFVGFDEPSADTTANGCGAASPPLPVEQNYGC